MESGFWISLKTKWTVFFRIILDPWVMLFLASTIWLMWYPTSEASLAGRTIFTILLALSSGVLGGLLRKNWLEQTEEGIIVARGKSAIRSLKLLLGNVVALERRVRLYIDRYSGKTSNPVTVELCLEEIIEKSINVQENVLNAIENWTDVIPEANVQTQIGIISELNLKISGLKKDIEVLKVDSAEKVGRTKQEIDNLQELIQQKEKELVQTRAELSEKKQLFYPGLISGLGTVTPGLRYYSTEPLTITLPTCKSCGALMSFSESAMNTSSQCDKCRNKTSSEPDK